MKTLQHQDCRECRENVEIIGTHEDLISERILQGMEKSGEQVAAYVKRRGQLLSVVTMKTRDVPQALSMDREFTARYDTYLRSLKTGEAIVMVTTEESNHVGIYKLPPAPLH